MQGMTIDEIQPFKLTNQIISGKRNITNQISQVKYLKN